MANEKYTKINKFQDLEVGQVYDVSEHPTCLMSGRARITNIRVWSDNLIDVELDNGTGKSYVEANVFRIVDPDKGKTLVKLIKDVGASDR